MLNLTILSLLQTLRLHQWQNECMIMFLVMEVSICNSKLGRELLWQFVQKNWQTLHDKYEGGLLFSGLVKVGVI